MIEHPDKNSFDKIWEKVISVEINNYKNRYFDLIYNIPNMKDEIWNTYKELNDFCKLNYMKDASSKIDRHKVCACYIIAISKVKPMRYQYSSDVNLGINEQLALTVGFSLLRAFIISSIEGNEKYSSDKKKELISKFDDGIKIPSSDSVYHGNYISNFVNELYFNIRDGNISILSVAHELYLLELLSLS